VGCISLQPSDCCPASQDRIEFVPTVEELCEVAVNHLKTVERGIVSFGQGCEGEPLLVGDRIAEAVAEFRRATDRGTIHLNTNGSLPEVFSKVAAAGLDSARISMNSPRAETYNAYYRPRTYKFADVEETVRRAVDAGLYTTLNLLIFPGVTDLPEEVEALERLVEKTGLHMVHFRNLSIDPRLYLEHLPPGTGRREDALGIRNLALRLKRKYPKLDLGYFNRPKEFFSKPLTTLEMLEKGLADEK
jgi:MoaA/NifB/PqqE/SkfB family radical SAM enzyme